MSSNDNNKIMKKEPERQVDDDERYCDNEKCPYASYICFEELENYRGKPWVCAKCVDEDEDEEEEKNGKQYITKTTKKNRRMRMVVNTLII